LTARIGSPGCSKPLVVTRERLEEIAARAPQPQRTGQGNGYAGGARRFNLDSFIEQHLSGRIRRITPYQGGRRLILDHCVFDPRHTGTSAAIIESADGALGYACLHSGCVDRHWRDVRELYEPGYREHRQNIALQVRQAPAIVEEEQAAPDPEPPRWPALDLGALYGLAGDFVNFVEPQTEAAAAALLIQFLAAFGNAAGKAVCRAPDGTAHYFNLFTLLCGPSSKARKGTAWYFVKQFFDHAEPEWTRERVQSGLSSGEGAIWAVRDAITRREPVRENGKVVDYQEVEVDPGVADKRLLLFESEFANVLKVLAREGNTLSAILRQAFDTGDIRTLTKNTPAKATGAHISIVAHYD